MFLGLWVIFSIIVWGGFHKITIDDQHIPSLINGITSATSILIGFSGVLLTLSFSNNILKLKTEKKYVQSLILVLGVSLFMLVVTYLLMINNPFHSVIKASLTGLMTAMLAFFSIQTLILDKMLETE